MCHSKKATKPLTTTTTTTTTTKPKLTLEALFKPLPPYVHHGEPPPCLDDPWIVYRLTRKADGYDYIG